MWYVLALFIGILIGFIISLAIPKRNNGPKNIGILKIAESDDGGQPYLFVELEQDVHTLFNEKIVSMKVKTIDINSLK